MSASSLLELTSEEILTSCIRGDFANFESSLNDYHLQGETLLSYCCRNGLRDSVKKLLARPDIDINKQSQQSLSPFMLSISNLHYDITKLLIVRPELDLQASGKHDFSYMDYALMSGETLLIKLLLLRDCTGTTDVINSELKSHPLLTRYRLDPVSVKREIADLLNIPLVVIPPSADDIRRQLYATIVCLCDDYFRVKTDVALATVDVAAVSDRDSDPDNACVSNTAAVSDRDSDPDNACVSNTAAVSDRDSDPDNACVSNTAASTSEVVATATATVAAAANKIRRFFNITRRLPLELQAVVCHRVVGSAKSIITKQELESVVVGILSVEKEETAVR